VLAFGVRPALRGARPPKVEAGKVKTTSTALPAGAVAAATPNLKPQEPAELDPERVRAQEIFEQVAGHLKREPSQSSRLLQSWIHSD